MIIRKNNIFDIDFSIFPNLKLIMFDIDETLAKHNDPTPVAGAKEYMSELKEKGYRTCLFSNNKIERIYNMSSCLGVKYIETVHKPSPYALRKLMWVQKLHKNEVVIVGDNYFTDGLCGKFSGVDVIIVNPVSQMFKKTENTLIVGKQGIGKKANMILPIFKK